MTSGNDYNICIKLEKITKSYKKQKKKIDVLSNVSCVFELGKFYAIMGHSGSGKSTLINILGLVDNFDKGGYTLCGKNVNDLNDKMLSKLRMKNIGFVFQNFYLNKNLKAFENVMVPMLINNEIASENRVAKSSELLKSVGLEDRFDHYPSELSGGEQQRVALARSLANNPSIILADEPTGNLDEKMANDIFKLLKEQAKKGKCVIVVSHSTDVKNYADIVYKITNGVLAGEEE